MKETQAFLIRGIIFVLIFLFLAVIIQSFLNKYHLDSDFLEFQNLRSALIKKADIIYFGDSTLAGTDKNETDMRSIGVMVENISEYRTQVTEIDNQGHHLGIYEAFSEYVCRSWNKPEVVIVPINLRSFGPTWDTNPSHQFEKEIVTVRYNDNVLMGIWARFYYLFTLNSEEIEAADVAWKDTIIYYKNKPIGAVGCIEKREDWEEQFIYLYMYDLDPGHRKLVSLDNLIRNYQKCGVDLVLYITPIDYQNGEAFMGAEFTKRVEQNKRIVLEIGERNNLAIADLSFALNSSDFIEGRIPSEHMNQGGRMYVAEELAKAIEQLKT